MWHEPKQPHNTIYTPNDCDIEGIFSFSSVMCRTEAISSHLWNPKKYGSRKWLLMIPWAIQHWRAFFTIQSGGRFAYKPFYLPHQPFGNCRCPTSVLPLSTTVRYGRANLTCQNHVIYEAFATVSLWAWSLHLYAWGASFILMFNSIYYNLHSDESLAIFILAYWPGSKMG